MHEETFTVSERFICNRSPVLKTACSTEWPVGQSKTVRLPDIAPRHFQIYLDWADSYGRASMMGLIEKTCLQLDGGKKMEVHLLLEVNYLCNLWTLGNALQDSKFKNHVMDEILKHELPKRRLLVPATIGDAIQEATSDSKLRSWMLDHMAPQVTTKYLDDIRSWLPADFAYELMSKIVAIRGKSKGEGVPGYEDRCKYHEHPAGMASCR